MKKNVWTSALSAAIVLAVVSGGMCSQAVLASTTDTLMAAASNGLGEKYDINISQSAHGRIETVEYQTNDPISSVFGGNYVDINVYPDDGYYLRDIRISGKPKIWYNDIDSLGFKMPENEVNIAAMFEKIPEGADKKPDSGMYLEYPVFKDGKRTSDRIYVPAVVKDVDGNAEVFSTDTVRLVKDRDYSIIEDDTNHTVTFKGLGGPASDSKRYIEYFGVPVLGEQTFSYIENNVPALHEGKNENCSFGEEYRFTPEKDARYEFRGQYTIKLLTIYSVTNPDEKIDVTETEYGPTVDLKAGTEYIFTIDTPFDDLRDQKDTFFIEKVKPHDIIKSGDHGTIKVTYMDGSLVTGRVDPNRLIQIIATPDGGYFIADTLITRYNRTISIGKTGIWNFPMPNSDFKIEGVFEKIPTPVKEDFTVTTSEVESQGYTDWETGKNIYKLDFTLNNNSGAAITAGKIELEFDAPVARYFYGAYIGYRTVTIDPSNPNKVIIDFSTYDPNGTSESISSELAIAVDATGDIHCTSAKVNVTKK